MTRTETCTPAERMLLDAIKAALPLTYQGCPICHYDGLGPETPELKKTLGLYLKEIGNEHALKTVKWFDLEGAGH